MSRSPSFGGKAGRSKRRHPSCGWSAGARSWMPPGRSWQSGSRRKSPVRSSALPTLPDTASTALCMANSMRSSMKMSAQRAHTVPSWQQSPCTASAGASSARPSGNTRQRPWSVPKASISRPRQTITTTRPWRNTRKCRRAARCPGICKSRRSSASTQSRRGRLPGRPPRLPRVRRPSRAS